MRLRLRQLVPVVPLIFATGCSSGEHSGGPGEAFSVRDSAGILIAENSAPQWTPATSWRISQEPFLVIGSRDAESPGADFAGIIDVTGLNNGRIVVADRGSLEIRVFDPSGMLLFSVGGQGEGPSEFVYLDRIGILRGDSIVAYDRVLLKHVVFGPDGSLGRVVRDPPPNWNGLTNLRVTGWLRDGSFIVNDEPRGSDLAPGTTVLERQWHHFDAEGHYVGEIAHLPYERRNEEQNPIAFGPEGTVRIAPAGLWYGFSDACDFLFYGPDGLEKVFRRDCDRQPISSTDKERFRRQGLEFAYASTIARIPSDQHAHARAQLEATFARRVFADSFPAFASFLPAKDGHLWVEQYGSVEDLLDPQRDLGRGLILPDWTVFSPEGRWLGTLTVPSGLNIHEVGDDYVLGVWTDSLDIPYVVLHRIEKPEID